MKNYAVELSGMEVKKAYSFLMDKINEHIKLLAESSKPITSIMGIKRSLIKLKLGYLQDTQTGPTQKMEITLNEEEQKLATEILETMNIDVTKAVEAGLIGCKDMKRQLVKYHYQEMAKSDMTYKEIKNLLRKKYGLSISSIEKLVYRHKD